MEGECSGDESASRIFFASLKQENKGLGPLYLSVNQLWREERFPEMATSLHQVQLAKFIIEEGQLLATNNPHLQ